MQTLGAVPIMLPLELYQLLSEASSKRKRTFADTVSIALNEFLERELGKPRVLQVIAKGECQ